MSIKRSEIRSYLNPTSGVALATQPQIEIGEDNAPVKIKGAVEGRMVAYWPTYEQARGRAAVRQDDGTYQDSPFKRPDDGKLRPMGSGGYIPAIIAASWASEPTEAPMVNLALQLDPSNHREALREHLTGIGSARYSAIPAQGCWTWIPAE